MQYEKSGERGFRFACALVDEFRMRKPTDDAERAIWWQLLDSGPSIGANATESIGAESGPDFSHKFHISLKEGLETLYWLRLLRHVSPDRAKRLDVLQRECNEIVSILVVSLKTSKRNEAARRKAARSRMKSEHETEERRTKTEERRTENGSVRRRRSFGSTFLTEITFFVLRSSFLVPKASASSEARMRRAYRPRRPR
jgi:four helix bundle protein